MKPRAAAARGFSLLEVLVALAIMAFSLGALYESIGRSTRQLHISDRTERATLWAQSLMARWPESGAGGWNDGGETPDGFDWRVRSARALNAEEAGQPVDLYEVEIVVGWADGGRRRSVTLATLLPQATSRSGLR